MQSKAGGIKKKPNIKTCKQCDKKRYANLSLCYMHWRTKEREKKDLKAKARLQRTQKSKKFQLSEFKKWHKKAWSVQSLYIRKSQANFQNLVTCYTCSAQLPYSEAQLGHFHHNKADFYKNNLKIQCPQCNLYKSGNLAVYATRLVQEIGQEGMVELEKYANTKIYSLDELKEVFEKYSQLIKTL